MNKKNLNFKYIDYSSIIQVIWLSALPNLVTLGSCSLLFIDLIVCCDINPSLGPPRVLFLNSDYRCFKFDSISLVLRHFNHPLGITFGGQRPECVILHGATVLLQAVFVVFEFLLKSLDGLLLVNNHILALFPLFIYPHECLVQHSVFLLQVLILARLSDFSFLGMPFKCFIVVLQGLDLFFEFDVFG